MYKELEQIVGQYPNGVPMVRITERAITFNKDAVRILGIGQSTRIAFFRDKRSPQDVYIRKNDSGYSLKRRCGRYEIYCRSLSRGLLSSLSMEKALLRIEDKTIINEEEMFPIFTRINYYGNKGHKN